MAPVGDPGVWIRSDEQDPIRWCHRGGVHFLGTGELLAQHHLLDLDAGGVGGTKLASSFDDEASRCVTLGTTMKSCHVLDATVGGAGDHRPVGGHQPPSTTTAEAAATAEATEATAPAPR